MIDILHEVFGKGILNKGLTILVPSEVGTLPPDNCSSGPTSSDKATDQHNTNLPTLSLQTCCRGKLLAS
jgi:hypothetical protein